MTATTPTIHEVRQRLRDHIEAVRTGRPVEPPTWDLVAVALDEAGQLATDLLVTRNTLARYRNEVYEEGGSAELAFHELMTELGMA